MSGRPRVGVLTFHRCINYGSFWQAKCLVDGLRERGFDAEILDHRSSRIEFAELRCALNPTLPTPVPRGDRPLYRTKAEQFFRAFESLPLSRPFCVDEPPPTSAYDTIVVGSDEVWNLQHPWFGGKAIFFGDGPRGRKLIAHAASFGHYRADHGLADEWRQRLRRFDHISVRDDNARRLVETATGFSPPLALDPCLQFPNHIDSSGAPESTEPYVVVYGHNFSESFARRVRNGAESRGLPLISIGYRNDWADCQRLTAGPREFAAFMAGATAVATNFFHGCVFALLNRRPFVCEASAYRSVKVRCLMEAVGGLRHVMEEGTPEAVSNDCLANPPSPEIEQRIAELRAASDEYLNRALAN